MKKKKSLSLNVHQQVILKQRSLQFKVKSDSIILQLNGRDIADFSAVIQPLCGVGRILSLSLAAAWRKWFRRWLSGWSDGRGISFICPEVLAAERGWGSKSLHILFPLYLTLTWLTLTLFHFCPLLIIRMGKKWKYQSLQVCPTLCSPPGSSVQNGTNKQNREESVCSQTKLSFIASALAYPRWRKCVCSEIGTWGADTWNNPDSSLGKRKHAIFCKVCFLRWADTSQLFFLFLGLQSNCIFSQWACSVY